MSAAGIPVMIHLAPEVFLKLERMAAKKRVGMRRMIEAHIERSLQPPTTKHEERANDRPAQDSGRRAYVVLTADQRSEVVELTLLGWSQGEIAKRFGCGIGTVRNIRRDAREAMATNHPDGSEA